MLKNATKLYDNLIDEYKKEYEQASKSKDNDWKRKYTYKNFKEFENYASIKDKKSDEESDEESGEESDEEVNIDWIYEPKDKFDCLMNRVNRYYADGLITKVRDEKIKLNNAK